MSSPPSSACLRGGVSGGLFARLLAGLDVSPDGGASHGGGHLPAAGEGTKGARKSGSPNSVIRLDRLQCSAPYFARNVSVASPEAMCSSVILNFSASSQRLTDVSMS